jgi:peroxiredoxin Q/BCP
MNDNKSQKKKINVGDQAPDFTLPDQDGKKMSLNNLIGKKAIVLYFYPKDNSPGCTSQACTFRDQYEIFKDHGAEVIGVSSDSVESHKQFQLKYNLPFTILSDTNGKARKLYGISSTLGLIPGRVTYIIDKKGIVRYIFSSQIHAKAHVDNALQVLLEIEASEKLNKPLEIKF